MLLFTFQEQTIKDNKSKNKKPTKLNKTFIKNTKNMNTKKHV